MKKEILKISIVILFCLVIAVPIYAQASIPTEWATEEIALAIENNLVIENQNYQSTIKRFEYVSLALKVLEKSGKSIDVVQRYPFSDLLGHPYENEIVQAFNAGLIKGYTDGTFKPNQEITRQEIASLIVNLVKLLNPKTDLKVSGITYADSNDISVWAKPYVDYCYKNEIMIGTGKNLVGLDIIDPKGMATIEQSIVLLYRFTVKEGLLKVYDLGEVEILSDSNNSTYTKSTVINQFARTYGERLALVIKALSEKEDIDIVNMDINNVSLSFANIGTINIAKFENVVDLNLMTLSIDNPIILDAYYQIAETYKDSEQLKLVVDRSIAGLSDDKLFVFNQSINQSDFFKAFSDTLDLTGQDISETTWYAFQYQLNLY